MFYTGKNFGKRVNYMGNFAEFSIVVKLEEKHFGNLKGHFGQKCSTPAKCWVRIEFGSDSKVKFGSSPVIIPLNSSLETRHWLFATKLKYIEELMRLQN